MKFILGLKIGMSQIFDEQGKVIPITLIEAGPCYVTQIKTDKIDKYKAFQIGFIKKTKKTLRQAQGGEPRRTIKKTEKGKEFKYLREQRTGNSEQYKVGDIIDTSIFKEGEKVKIAGISKGKGFQGVVKRWRFKGRLSATHGTKHELRTGGSTGSSVPERVIKGKKMAGHMGFERVMVKNLKIAKVDKENNLLAIKGAVPGRKGTLLEIRSGI